MTLEESATRKRKPWYRLRNIILAVLGFIVLVLGWAVVEVLRVHTAEPVVSVNYRAKHRELVEASLPTPPQHPDEAWGLLIDLADRSATLLDRIESEVSESDFAPRDDLDTGQLDFARISTGATLPPDIDRELAAIHALREAGIFDDLDRFVEIAPGLPPTDNDKGMFIEHLPLAGALRDLVRVERARIRIAAHEGRSSDVLPSLERSLAAARTIAMKPGIIWSLVAIACQAVVLSEIRHVLQEYELDEDICLDLLAALDRQSLPSVGLTMEGERSVILDLFQRSFSDDGTGNGYFAAGSLSDITEESTSLLASIEGRFLIADRSTVESLLHEFFDGIIAESMLPVDAREERGFDEHAFRQRVRADMRLRIVDLIIPAVTKTLNHRYRFENERSATRLMLAIELHKARSGSYPANLDSLTPDLIPVIPVDQINGISFEYERLDNEPHGRPYLLYSLGVDGEDDYVLNPPREELDE